MHIRGGDVFVTAMSHHQVDGTLVSHLISDRAERVPQGIEPCAPFRNFEAFQQFGKFLTKPIRSQSWNFDLSIHYANIVAIQIADVRHAKLIDEHQVSVPRIFWGLAIHQNVAKRLDRPVPKDHSAGHSCFGPYKIDDACIQINGFYWDFGQVVACHTPVDAKQYCRLEVYRGGSLDEIADFFSRKQPCVFACAVKPACTRRGGFELRTIPYWSFDQAVIEGPFERDVDPCDRIGQPHDAQSAVEVTAEATEVLRSKIADKPVFAKKSENLLACLVVAVEGRWLQFSHAASDVLWKSGMYCTGP